MGRGRWGERLGEGARGGGMNGMHPQTNERARNAANQREPTNPPPPPPLPPPPPPLTPILPTFLSFSSMTSCRVIIVTIWTLLMVLFTATMKPAKKEVIRERTSQPVTAVRSSVPFEQAFAEPSRFSRRVLTTTMVCVPNVSSSETYEQVMRAKGGTCMPRRTTCNANFACEQAVPWRNSVWPKPVLLPDIDLKTSVLPSHFREYCDQTVSCRPATVSLPAILIIGSTKAGTTTIESMLDRTRGLHSLRLEFHSIEQVDRLNAQTPCERVEFGTCTTEGLLVRDMAGMDPTIALGGDGNGSALIGKDPSLVYRTPLACVHQSDSLPDPAATSQDLAAFFAPRRRNRVGCEALRHPLPLDYLAREWRRWNPNAMNIQVLRDPVERARSHFTYTSFRREGRCWAKFGQPGPCERLASGPTTPESFRKCSDCFHEEVVRNIGEFQDCLAAGNSELMCAMSPFDTLSRHDRIVSIGLYVVFLESWMKIWPRSSFCFVEIADKDNVDELYRCLGIPPAWAPPIEVANSLDSKVGGMAHIFDHIASNRTKTLLDSFYRPFNERLCKLIGESCKEIRFLRGARRLPQ
jgi:hypothetical protein